MKHIINVRRMKFVISLQVVMEIRDHVSELFTENQCLYVHCIDLRVEKVLHLKSMPCIGIFYSFSTRRFPAKLSERSAVLFLHSEENISKISGLVSPLLFNVKSSCIHTISFILASF